MMWKCFDERQEVQEHQDARRLCTHHATPPSVTRRRGTEQRSESRPDEVRHRLPRGLGEDARILSVGDDATAVVDEPADHDRPDEGEDQIGLPVGLPSQSVLRRLVSIEARRMGDAPAHQRNGDP